MTIITRFAPSPTGHLHVGNLRTALHNWMWARKTGGAFWLRLDDTDAERSREEYAASIRDDLAWLGLSPDGEVRQSDRFALYEENFARLEATGRVYPCYETAQELDLKRKVLLGRGLPPVYDRAALALDDAGRAALEAEGRRPHWRFRLDRDTPIAWDDLVRGPQHFDPALLSDPVIRREDGSWLYMLPSVIDDIDMGVTHVVRGEDHVSNTATQIQMFAALGATAPQFAHAALLVGSEGKLSKRLGSLGVAHFREAGLEPVTLVALLARLGTSDPVEPVKDARDLLQGFDFAHFGRAPARFDEAELEQLNARILHLLDYQAVAARLPAGMDEAAWNVVRANITHVPEAALWFDIISGDTLCPHVALEDREYIGQAADSLSEMDFDTDIWPRWTAILKEKAGRKGKALFLPLRLALTGREYGPDMRDLLPLIGKERALHRLRAAAAGR